MMKEAKKFNIEDLPDVATLEQELKATKYRDRYKRTLKSTIFTLVTVSAIAILVATIWLPVLQIYGNSMTPTLKSGDVVVSVNARDLKHGDVVAFYYNNKVLLKRVIATSGEWVDVDKKGNVTVNGKKLDEPYLKEKSFGNTNIKLPYQVPDEKVFVMGDHRSVSIDSRNTAVGPVDQDQIVGKLSVRIWPLNRFGTF